MREVPPWLHQEDRYYLTPSGEGYRIAYLIDSSTALHDGTSPPASPPVIAISLAMARRSILPVGVNISFAPNVTGTIPSVRYTDWKTISR